MEVYVLRRMPNDGVKKEYYKDVKSVYSWRSEKGINLNIIDNFVEGCFLCDVIKFEVF